MRTTLDVEGNLIGDEGAMALANLLSVTTRPAAPARHAGCRGCTACPRAPGRRPAPARSVHYCTSSTYLGTAVVGSIKVGSIRIYVGNMSHQV